MLPFLGEAGLRTALSKTTIPVGISPRRKLSMIPDERTLVRRYLRMLRLATERGLKQSITVPIFHTSPNIDTIVFGA